MIFLEKLYDTFLRYPDRPAFCIDEKYYTYSWFYDRVSAIYAQLTTTYSDVQRIGVVAANDIHTYASLVAILFSGKTYIPIHPGYPPHRIDQITRQANITLLLAGSDDATYTGIPRLNVAGIVAAGSMPRTENTVLTSYAYILFTSGSTGVPKGVPITYDNLNSFVDAFAALGYQISEQDRFLQMFDLTFDLSVMSYIIPLCTGACVYTISDKGIKYTGVYEVLEKHKISFALMVPSILSHLRPFFEEIYLPEMRYNLFCGEALYAEIVDEWKKCIPGAIIENVYGPTEATIFCLTYNINTDLRTTQHNGIVPIGRAMNNMEAIVIGTDLDVLAMGQNGELCLHGGQVTPGYLEPQNTRKAFVTIRNKQYYRTGDICYADDSGNFIYCGRLDNQVKIQGFRIELSEIEFHVRKLTGLSNVIAFAVPVATGSQQIEIALESNEHAVSRDKLLQDIRQCLPTYMIPAKIHFASAFPLNANGKIDRPALRKLLGVS